MVVSQAFCSATGCCNMGAAPMLAQTLTDWENSITTTIMEPINEYIGFFLFAIKTVYECSISSCLICIKVARK